MNTTSKRQPAQPSATYSPRSGQLPAKVRQKLRRDAARRERLGLVEEAIVLSLDEIPDRKTNKGADHGE